MDRSFSLFMPKYCLGYAEQVVQEFISRATEKGIVRRTQLTVIEGDRMNGYLPNDQLGMCSQYLKMGFYSRLLFA